MDVAHKRRLLELSLITVVTLSLLIACLRLVFINDNHWQLSLLFIFDPLVSFTLLLLALAFAVIGTLAAGRCRYFASIAWMMLSVCTVLIVFSDENLLHVALAAALVGVLRAGVILRRRMYLTSIAWVTVSPCTLLLGLSGRELGDHAYFLLNKSAYEKVYAEVKSGVCRIDDLAPPHPQIDVLQCAHPTVIVFPWTWFSSGWSGVVFDSADEIAKPGNSRWLEFKDSEWAVLLSCSGTTASFGNHYYAARGWYRAIGQPC